MHEDWGLLQSLRTFYTDGNEIEFGLTTEEWLSPQELSGSTGSIIKDGMKIIYDPNALFKDINTSNR